MGSNETYYSKWGVETQLDFGSKMETFFSIYTYVRMVDHYAAIVEYMQA
jgi:hypothetical protein